MHVPQTEGAQIGDHRLSTSCEVVERSDYHCGDDLVFFTSERSHSVLLGIVYKRSVSLMLSSLSASAKFAANNNLALCDDLRTSLQSAGNGDSNASSFVR